MAERAVEDQTGEPAPNESGGNPEDDGNESSPVADEDGSPADKKVVSETATDATAESTSEEKRGSGSPAAVVSSNKKSRPPYKYDPNKITLRFLFANRDGLTVTVECEPSDTVGEVKGALLSVWPEDLPDCSGGDRLRLVCMGKGYLMPDTRTLEDCQIPTFKTHPTPINVSVAPEPNASEEVKKKNNDSGAGGNGNRAPNSPTNTSQANQGCACVIL